MSQLSRNLGTRPDCPTVQGSAAQTPPRPLLQPQDPEGTPSSVPAPLEPKVHRGCPQMETWAGAAQGEGQGRPGD